MKTLDGALVNVSPEFDFLRSFSLTNSGYTYHICLKVSWITFLKFLNSTMFENCRKCLIGDGHINFLSRSLSHGNQSIFKPYLEEVMDDNRFWTVLIVNYKSQESLPLGQTLTKNN